jgi:hypothetical protein
VNLVGKELVDDSDAEICVTEWVDTPRPISCSFLKPNEAKRDEMRYTFDVSKCDKLFDILVQGGVIRLKEGHVISAADLIAKKVLQMT